jgi:serine/threonine protein phosphatase PrpC
MWIATLYVLQLTTCSNVEVFVSGTTGTIGYIDGRRLHVANVGDSRAVLGRRVKSGEIVALDLSVDHKPDRYVCRPLPQ